NAATITLAKALGTLTITGSEYVGATGTGNLNLTGGTHTINFGLYFGYNAGAIGSGTMGGNAVLSVGNEEYIGFTGNGSFTQTGGSNTTFYLTMGYNAAGNGFGTNVGSG